MNDEKQTRKGSSVPLLISFLALIISLYAVSKIGGISAVQSDLQKWKRDLQQQLQNVRKSSDQRIEDLSLEIDLLEANASLIEARLSLAVEKNAEKALAEVEKSKSWLQKAHRSATGDMKKAIGQIQEDLSKIGEMLKDGSDRAGKELTALWGRLEKLIRVRETKKTMPQEEKPSNEGQVK